MVGLRKLTLYSALFSLCFTPPAQAANLNLTYGWYISPGGTASIDTSGTLVIGTDTAVHNTITKQVTKNAQYRLKASASIVGTNSVNFGIVSFDAKSQKIQDQTITLTQGTTPIEFDFLIPDNAASTMILARSYKNFKGTATIKNLIVTKLDPNSNKLKYAPPPLVNPITLTLGTGATFNTLRNDRDYIIKLPAAKKVGSTGLVGGHNVVLIGGHITVPKGDTLQRGIYIKDNKGTVHIEGVLIDGTGGAESDAIVISAPESVVQIENVRVDGIIGRYSSWHADVVQPWGGVKEMRVDKLTGYSGYQGFQINQDRAPIGKAVLSRINLGSTGPQIWGTNNNGGFLFWATTTDQCNGYPIELSDVYVNQRKERPIDKAVWPVSNKDSFCASKISDDQKSITFPKLPITGKITLGLPVSGDYVPNGLAGVTYQSPGYTN